MKSEPDWGGGPHLCHRTLDRLAEYVNEGILQTVVDQVNVVAFSNMAIFIAKIILNLISLINSYN